MKIAFLQFGAGGDIIWATCILHKVRQLYPDDEITWICFDQYRDFIKENHDIDSYIAWPLNPGETRQQQERKRWEEIKEYAYQNFDLSIIPQHWPDHELEWDNSTEDTITDYMIRWANQSEPRIGLLNTPDERKTHFKYSERDHERAQTFLDDNALDLKEYICITPYAVTVDNDINAKDYELITKYWPADKIIYFGSKNDKPLSFGIDGRGTTFGTMAALAKMSCGCIGLESGPAYIFASFYDLPLVVFRNARISQRSGVPLHKQGLIKTMHRTENILEILIDDNIDKDETFKGIIDWIKWINK